MARGQTNNLAVENVNTNGDDLVKRLAGGERGSQTVQEMRREVRKVVGQLSPGGFLIFSISIFILSLEFLFFLFYNYIQCMILVLGIELNFFSVDSFMLFT